MPKSTFINLPPAKRQAILDAAIAEFSAHPYAGASISRIVTAAGIAKGSLYQYFANKQDFFLYLVEYAVQTQLQLLQSLTPPAPTTDFFGLLRWQMSASLRVGLAAPHLARLLQRAFADDVPFQAEVNRVVGTAGSLHLEQLVHHGIHNGDLRADLDVPLTVFVLQRVLGELGAHITRQLDLSLDAVAADLTLLDRPEVEAIYDHLLALLRSGLAR